MLCNHCQYLLQTKWCLAGPEIAWKRELKTLFEGQNTCHLCKRLLDWLPKEGPNDTFVFVKKNLTVHNAVVWYYVKIIKQLNFDGWYVMQLNFGLGSDVKLGPGVPPFMAFGIVPDNAVKPVSSVDLLDQSTGGKQALWQARECFHKCLGTHRCCKAYSQILASNGSQSRPFRPTRLIQILPDRIRLHETKNIAYNYLTLSHRWPSDLNAAPLLRLTAKNYNAFMNTIPESVNAGFSQVFQDAVRVCRVLAVEYLWIDSLCIIQQGDDGRDWIKESESVSGSDGGMYAGMFTNRDFASIMPVAEVASFKEALPVWGLSTVDLIDRLRRENPIPGKYFLMPTTDFHATISKAELSKRGWCKQERILSPRILHFTSKQIYWDCYDSMADEAWPNGNPTWARVWENRPWTILQDLALHHAKVLGAADMTPHIKSATEDLMTSWYRVVYAYARTELTHGTDRLVAISGLARSMAPYLNTAPSDYLAGVWRQSMPYGLLWSARWINRPPGKRVRSNQYQAPSWSWASVNWVVTLEAYETNQSPHEVVAMVSTYQMDLVSAADPFGQVRPRSHIVLKAKMFKVSISWIASNTNYKGSKYWPKLHFGLISFVNKMGNVICPDEMYLEGHTKDKTGLFLVPVMKTRPENNIRWVKGLLLERTNEAGVYQRYGYVHLVGEDVKWFNVSTGNLWGVNLSTKSEELITIV